MSGDDAVTLAMEGRIARLTLSRPEVLNAIDERLCDLLERRVDALVRDGSASVVVVHGAGARAFSAGADLTFMRALAGESLRRFIEKTWRVFDRLATAPFLTVAAVHGYALGGGAELALACDFRVVEDDARIGFPEMTLGSVPGSGAMQRLPRLVGPSRALDIVLGGERIGGDEAVRIGLANRLAPPGGALAAAMDWARILAERPPEAVRYAKACASLGPDSAIPALLHGLVSAACQSATGYRTKTGRFAAAEASS